MGSALVGLETKQYNLLMWREAQLPIRPCAVKKILRGKLSLFALALALPFLLSAAHPAIKVPILVITLDTTRADRFGCLGGKNGLTPHLDDFSKRAFVFTHCEAPCPQTLPSHTSLFSGWDPIHHGVRKNLEENVPPSVPLLAEEFKRAGYDTAAFVSAFILLPRYGLERGFNNYDASFYDSRHPEKRDRRADETLGAAAKWLVQEKSPFFCWIHLYDPHYPYEPPEPYAARYADSLYNGEIAYMDSAIGRFFGRLETAGMLDKCLIIICADHGEGLGDHGEKMHGVFLYDSTTHVPLLVHLPGQLKKAALDQDVGLVDVAPTLRAFCGLAPVPSDGVSLMPIFDGRPFQRKPVYIESLDAMLDFGWAPLYAMVENHEKFILAPRPEFYRLKKDPGEARNLASPSPEEAAALRKSLERYISEASTVATEKRTLSNEELRNLQSLGYIAGTAGRNSPPGRGKDPKDGVAVLDLLMDANLLVDQKKIPEAAAKFEDVLKLDPNNGFAALSLGKCIEDENPQRALSLYKAAIKINPSDSQPYCRAVALLISMDRAGEADSLVRLGLGECHDTTGELHVLWAWTTYLRGGSSTEVSKHLEEAESFAPELPRAFMLSALLAMRAQDREKAIRCLQEMAAVCPPKTVLEMEVVPWVKALRDDPRVQAVFQDARAQMH